MARRLFNSCVRNDRHNIIGMQEVVLDEHNMKISDNSDDTNFWQGKIHSAILVLGTCDTSEELSLKPNKEKSDTCWKHDHDKHYTVIWSAAVRYLIYLARESRYWAKRKLSPISVLPCQINQISGKQLTKQLFCYSRPEC